MTITQNLNRKCDGLRSRRVSNRLSLRSLGVGLLARLARESFDCYSPKRSRKLATAYSRFILAMKLLANPGAHEPI